MVNEVMTMALFGIDCIPVTVEADISSGLPGIDMIGMLGTEVREARERVSVALKNSGVDIPPKKITISLSPGDVRKEGTGFDLAIAAALLICMDIIPRESLRDTVVIGEVGLDGSLRHVNGVLPVVIGAQRKGIRRIVLPKVNVNEAAVIEGMDIVGISDIKNLIEVFSGSDIDCIPKVQGIYVKSDINYDSIPDYIDIRGQEAVKRGMCIAAAGFHNVLMIGPPGSGKSMAAKRLPSIMPPLTYNECIEVSKIYSVSGLLGEDKRLITSRPFIQPHHTSSDVSMAGGGRIPRPGMISLAHKGVLFLDEVVHFNTSALEILRQPIEDKKIHVARMNWNYDFPADFMLVAAMNPCPCGYYPDMNKCKCTPEQIRRYIGRLSGPLLDRIDICMDIPRLDIEDMTRLSAGRSSSDMREDVMRAIDMQKRRYEKEMIDFNSQLSASNIDKYIELGVNERHTLENICNKLELSLRAYHRILKVSRTIADMEGAEQIESKHIMEAVCYRSVEDKYWGNING